MTVGATAAGIVGVVGVGGGVGIYAAAIEIANVIDEVTPFESVTAIVIVEVPAAVGIPLTSPVAGLRVKPTGNDPFVIANAIGGTPPSEIGVIE